jgi:KDO2-lipid IV(A) lauroyltransferase
LEYGVFRLLAGLAVALPHRAALGLAWLVAAFLFHGARFRRAETLRRIRSVLGSDLPPRQARRIAWLSLRNLAFNAVEMLRIRRFTAADLRRIMPGLDAVIARVRASASARGGAGGAILGIPHMGNWDLAGSACHLAGAPIFSVAARQRNPLMNRFIQELRGGHGMAILERGAGMLRQVVERLNAGQLFAILPDTRAREPGLRIPFLGGEANLARGMAAFARTARVPILPVILRREGWCRVLITLEEPVWPDPALDKEEDLERMTRTVLAIIDRAIRETPEQWFWYNRRWVLEPLPAPAFRA